MICVRTRYGKEVRLPAGDGETSGTLRWDGGEIVIAASGGEIVITPALAAEIPCPEKYLGEIQCLLTSGDRQYMIVYIHKPQEAGKRWQST